MTNEELKEKYSKIMKDMKLVCLHDITDINHKPHPYTIGTRHVGWASDHWNGMLGTDAIEDAERNGIRCAARGCNLTLAQHTSDKVMAVTLNDDRDREGIQEELKIVIDHEIEKDGIQGFIFIKD